MRRGAILGVAMWALAPAAHAAPARPAAAATPAPVAEVVQPLGPGFDTPYHNVLENVVVGAQAELRFASDRVLGVANPDWASVQRASGFARARFRRGIQIVAEIAYDKATDDFVVERALIVARVRRTMDAQAGVLLVPLGSTNLEHDAPRGEFNERSLVATELIGVPNAQLGLGVRGVREPARGTHLTYEADLVTGYDDGLINDSAHGTRLPRGRNNGLDNNGIPALVGRIAVQPGADTEFGLAALAGSYNTREVGGVTVDQSRGLAIALADARARRAGFRLAGEVAAAFVNVPPGLVGVFAERQWAASLEATRTLREPILAAWSGSSLDAALRADAVDFDRDVPGDSRSRVSASLNLRPLPTRVVRFGWYYELRRDRFNNDVPAAGLTLSLAACL